MNDIRKFIWRIFLFLFIILFIFPALLFSVLVLELTDSWESGTLLLGSTVFLIVVVMVYDLTRAPSPSRRQTPPSLNEIYREMDIHQGED
ncbi:hypothetical protein PAAL109150_04590 [Paenibacillus alkaliterrae]